jgi:hypothetical protein
VVTGSDSLKMEIADHRWAPRLRCLSGRRRPPEPASRRHPAATAGGRGGEEHSTEDGMQDRTRPSGTPGKRTSKFVGPRINLGQRV